MGLVGGQSLVFVLEPCPNVLVSVVVSTRELELIGSETIARRWDSTARNIVGFGMTTIVGLVSGVQWLVRSLVGGRRLPVSKQL